MTIKPNGFEPPHLLPALFETDKTNPHLTKAAELREIFARDAIERDQLGGRPDEQIKLLKETGLVNLLIPREFGGAGEHYSTAMRIVREFSTAITSAPCRMPSIPAQTTVRAISCAARPPVAGSGAIRPIASPRASSVDVKLTKSFSTAFGHSPPDRMSPTI